MLKLISTLSCCIALLGSPELIADEELRLGMSVALSGPAKDIGQQLRQGADLYFNYANSRANKTHPTISLVVLDDGYEPNRTVVNTRYLIEQHQVMALFGNMGTPTAHAIQAILTHHQLPFLMPFTGADFLRHDPPFPVFNWRASYMGEASEQVTYLVDEQGHKHIALFIQADEFGLTLEKSFRRALADRGMQPTVIARFRRNSADIKKALQVIMRSEATAVAMIGTYQPLSIFIDKAMHRGFKGTFSGVSFTSSRALFAQLTSTPTLMISEVVPALQACQAELCDLFRKLAREQGLQTSPQVFEGFLNAAIFTAALKHCPRPITRGCLPGALQQVLTEDKAIRYIFGLTEKENKPRVYRSYFQ
ncbi:MULTISPECIES: ABC transporter substrate-binding protein [unclassified Pseudoalteromonas]|uniref:ABC transporter substrate-binding protein n=1 Tax=unclassified Pseudoalteromonas TaxID=194690 RepID=UPI00209801DE|nr:ABC transporter substrate-binding protein [Pseudoalteromonas sp. XMcav2-N]MCO7189908.1 ABC transporter substrate-binding protein [Pseudoalteromonas sp. XMcav2-N]